jgi:hypothetical protein
LRVLFSQQLTAASWRHGPPLPLDLRTKNRKNREIRATRTQRAREKVGRAGQSTSKRPFITTRTRLYYSVRDNLRKERVKNTITSNLIVHGASTIALLALLHTTRITPFLLHSILCQSITSSLPHAPALLLHVTTPIKSLALLYTLLEFLCFDIFTTLTTPFTAESGGVQQPDTSTF